MKKGFNPSVAEEIIPHKKAMKKIMSPTFISDGEVNIAIAYTIKDKAINK